MQEYRPSLLLLLITRCRFLAYAASKASAVIKMPAGRRYIKRARRERLAADGDDLADSRQALANGHAGQDTSDA